MGENATSAAKPASPVVPEPTPASPVVPEPTPASPVVPEPTPAAAALAHLQEHVATLKTRYREIEDLFKDFPVSPLKSTDFKKFLEDHTCMITMRYITMGKFVLDDLEGAEPAAVLKDEILRAKGFAVSGAPAEAPSTLDPALTSNPAALAALASGFNLDRDPEDDGDLPVAKPKA